jgi:hypothetical protein
LCGGGGAEAGGRFVGVDACDSLRILIGMAEATAFAEAPALSLESDVDIPAGEATDEGRIKSSKFIGSVADKFE